MRGLLRLFSFRNESETLLNNVKVTIKEVVSNLKEESKKIALIELERKLKSYSHFAKEPTNTAKFATKINEINQMIQALWQQADEIMPTLEKDDARKYIIKRILMACKQAAPTACVRKLEPETSHLSIDAVALSFNADFRATEIDNFTDKTKLLR